MDKKVPQKSNQKQKAKKVITYSSGEVICETEVKSDDEMFDFMNAMNLALEDDAQFEVEQYGKE